MKEKQKFIKFIRELMSVVFFALSYSIIYTLIVYGNFNFIDLARNKSKQNLETVIEEVSIEKARNNFNKAIVIDARKKENYLDGHIPGAINIPVIDFDNYIEKIIDLPQDTLIIIYCESIHCNFSHQLAEKLQMFGFKNLWIINEGFEGWLNRKLTVEK